MAVVGYDRRSHSSLRLDGMPTAMRKRLPRYPDVPVTLFGRLAISASMQHVGLGTLLVVMRASARPALKDVASMGMLVRGDRRRSRRLLMKRSGSSAFWRPLIGCICRWSPQSGPSSHDGVISAARPVRRSGLPVGSPVGRPRLAVQRMRAARHTQNQGFPDTGAYISRPRKQIATLTFSFVLTLRRFTVMLLAVAFGLLPLGAAGPHCASRTEMVDATVAHGSMPMPAPDGDVAQTASMKECDSCPSETERLPCEHDASGICASMTSCATATAAAETQTMQVARTTRSFQVIANAAQTPNSPTASPDTPPPRA
jgi:hypothetical protein